MFSVWVMVCYAQGAPVWKVVFFCFTFLVLFLLSLIFLAFVSVWISSRCCSCASGFISRFCGCYCLLLLGLWCLHLVTLAAFNSDLLANFKTPEQTDLNVLILDTLNRSIHSTVVLLKIY